MIRQILRLTRWEFFKIRRRWLPWLLLAVIVIMNQLSLWTIYVTYSNETYFFSPVDQYVVISLPPDADGVASAIKVSCDDIDDGKVESILAGVPDEFREQAHWEVAAHRERCPEIRDQIAAQRQLFLNTCILPGSLGTGLKSGKDFVTILVIILATAIIGKEYSLGTFRPALTRGPRRWQFLGAKALSIVLISGAGLLFVVLTVVVGSLAMALLTGEDLVTAESGTWSSSAVIFVKMICALLPYIAVSMFFTVLTSSGTGGVSISLLYFFGDLIAAGPLTSLFGQHVVNYMLGPNVMLVLQTDFPLPVEEGVGIFASLLDLYLNPFLVMLAYTVVSGAGAFWIFLRRDVTGPRGE